MKGSSVTKTQLCSVGNYHMTGKLLGKGHFARVEEATHCVLGKKVAVKIVDLSCIKEEYARRHLQREPRVMSRLRHPCIAMLYETIMCGPRLYLVMEACSGGDLCSHVLQHRDGTRGLAENRARHLATQLVSAVQHMHSSGVVHRDLKMENIMLDGTKQVIKIVDFGLSNVWTTGSALRTPCGSFEYAAPELFVDGRRYGPEVDLWSIGVIVYGMVTGGLPFTVPAGANEGTGGGCEEVPGTRAGDGVKRDRSMLSQIIARGFGRKQRVALGHVSSECKNFVKMLLQPDVKVRLKMEEAVTDAWIRRRGKRMRTHPLGTIGPKPTREIYKQISELSGISIIDVVSQIRDDPFGAAAGMFNIKSHQHLMQLGQGIEMLWTARDREPNPAPLPEYKGTYDYRPYTAPCNSIIITSPKQNQPTPAVHKPLKYNEDARLRNKSYINSKSLDPAKCPVRVDRSPSEKKTIQMSGGDVRRLPCITERSQVSLTEAIKFDRSKVGKACTPGGKVPTVRRAVEAKPSEHVGKYQMTKTNPKMKTEEFYHRAGDFVPSRKASIHCAVSQRVGLRSSNNTTTIKRSSMGNITSPHSSAHSHSISKSENAATVGSTCSSRLREIPHLQRFRRTTPTK